MKLKKEQRLEIIKLEMELIQNTFNKYDDLIFRNRNWFITLWLGCIGICFTIKSPLPSLLAIALCIIYWFLEGMMRFQYWYKYVIRYRAIRDFINSSKLEIKEFSLYDLTNHYGEDKTDNLEKFKKCFIKKEPIFLYIFMALTALTTYVFLIKKWI